MYQINNHKARIERFRQIKTIKQNLRDLNTTISFLNDIGMSKILFLTNSTISTIDYIHKLYGIYLKSLDDLLNKNVYTGKLN